MSSFSWPSTSAALYISGQLLRLNRAVSGDDRPSELTRYSGGHSRSLQPHISGHHHVLFYLPELLFNTNIGPARRWLTSTCESFTPHSYTINTTDVIGLGQCTVSYPVSRVVNREFSLSFREFEYLPILSIIKTWHSIFDPLTGMSPLGTFILSPSVYKASVIVAIVKPTCDSSGEISEDDLEEAYIYNGAFPLNCPEDTVVSSDQANNDVPLATVNFKFDGSPLDTGYHGVKETVLELLSDYSYNNVYNNVGINLQKS